MQLCMRGGLRCCSSLVPTGSGMVSKQPRLRRSGMGCISPRVGVGGDRATGASGRLASGLCWVPAMPIGSPRSPGSCPRSPMLGSHRWVHRCGYGCHVCGEDSGDALHVPLRSISGKVWGNQRGVQGYVRELLLLDDFEKAADRIVEIGVSNGERQWGDGISVGARQTALWALWSFMWNPN
eukprot:18182_5